MATGRDRGRFPLIPRLSLSPVALFLRPSRFVRLQPRIHATTRCDKIRALTWLTGVYLLNVVLYAIPLAVGSPAYPGWGPILIFPNAMLTVSTGLIVVSGVTFWTFHIGLRVTRNAEGMLQSFQSVVYSTGVYLALAFGFVYTTLRVAPIRGIVDPTPVGRVFQSWIHHVGYWAVQTVRIDIYGFVPALAPVVRRDVLVGLRIPRSNLTHSSVAITEVNAAPFLLQDEGSPLLPNIQYLVLFKRTYPDIPAHSRTR